MTRRSLGQHYLVDQAIIDEVIATAAIAPDERVLEIGTGKGALTGILAALGKSYLGYEIDRGNFELTAPLARGPDREVVLGDAFANRPDFDVLVASLPYSRSSEFVDWLGGMKYDRAVVLLQEDFVKKLTAAPGTRDYRGVSAISQISSNVKVVAKVHRSSFSPPPKVGSVLARVTPRARLSADEVALIKRFFSLRRRQVGSVLVEFGMKSGKDYGSRRVYSLSPDEVRSLISSSSP